MALALPAPAAARLLRLDAPPRPSGIVVWLHGGGWKSNAALGLDPAPPELPLPRAISASIDYRTGARSVTDVLRGVRRLRHRYPDLPICAWGGSAGGHLALVTEPRAGYDCIVAEAAPLDLRSRRTANPGGEWLWGVVQRFWPTARERRAVSPVTLPDRAPTLLAASACDYLIPLADVRDYAQRIGAQLEAFANPPAGVMPFGHCLLPDDPQPNPALARYEQRRWRFLRHWLNPQRRI